MAIVSFYLWWYTSGWALFARQSIERNRRINENFSIPDLLKTLFRPFRQISSNEKGKGLQGILSVFLDQTISRFVGFIARITIIIVATLCILLHSTIALAIIIIWPVLAILPIIGLIFSIAGVTL